MRETRHAVLIADDYEADRFFITETIRKYAPKLEVVSEASDAEDVVAYLSGDGRFANRAKYPPPALIILDVRMPRMTGVGVLEWLKSHPVSNLKVALLADSSPEPHRPKAKELNGDHCYSKIGCHAELVELMKRLQKNLRNGS